VSGGELFGSAGSPTRAAVAHKHAPLAARMRPRTLDEYAGQQHLLGPGKLLARMIEARVMTSIILHGPPGTGKTTLAEIIAATTGCVFVRENAAAVGVARVREVAELARRRLADGGKRTVLFLDEIHRFSRAQQDVLLGDVESGVLTLIGATTENPLFAVNAALVSRSTLLRLEPLSEVDIASVLERALRDEERGLGKLVPARVVVLPEAIAALAVLCDGDVRRALAALELAVLSAVPKAMSHAAAVIDAVAAEQSIQKKQIAYDHTGDGHYDAISALIKSVRGSDPDAACYWAAVMLEAGDDPRFICRRLAILASEDIGNADPRALMLADAAWQLVERIGMPEARITIGQLITYLALAPKSNASYLAINEALADVAKGRTLAVPAAIKDRRVRKAAAASGIDSASGPNAHYQYTHDVQTQGEAGETGGVSGQDYLGTAARYYRPTLRGHELELGKRLDAILAERTRLRSEGA